MSKVSIWGRLTISLAALFCLCQAFAYGLNNGVTFRAQTSYIVYHFNKTSAFSGAIFKLEFSSTSCNGELIQVTSRDTDNFFRIYLEEENRVTFYYKHEDGDFDVQMSLPGNESFCDGQRHSIEIKRHGKSITYRADNGMEKREEDTSVKVATFSKPDTIMVGGTSGNKFDGCLFSALVVFHWKTQLSKNVSVDIIERFLKRDPRIRSGAVFVGACPSSEIPGTGGYEIQECTRSNTNISMVTERGVIASPHPRNASHVSRCLWRINAPSKHRLKFTMLFYNVSGVVSCSESEVVVFDGISSASAVLERFCYAKSNTVVYTRGHRMMVDMSLPKSEILDFIAAYEVVGLDEGPCPTNRRLTGMSGSLMSPNFPNNYEFEHACSWIVSVPRGYHVLITFNTADFHIDACNESCACDFLEVRAGMTSKGKFIERFCGSFPPSPIYVRGSDVWLRFVTNKLWNNKGFLATYKAVDDLADECPWNKTFSAHRGYINSPRFALDYPGNMECIWRIHVPKKYRVSFVFLAAINLDPNCTDFLEIRDGLHESSPLLKRYCGSTEPRAPSNVFSSGREMFVRFKSDSYLRGHSDGSKSGFRASYFATHAKSGAAILIRDLYVIFLLVVFPNCC